VRHPGQLSPGRPGLLTSSVEPAKDVLRLARRFRDHRDMILRFTTDLAVGFTSNQAERDIRSVKVQQRSSGGSCRTIEGLADFAIIQSYVSTAAKWGIDAFDALTQLFTIGPWLPAASGLDKWPTLAPARHRHHRSHRLNSYRVSCRPRGGTA
jgi:transposase